MRTAAASQHTHWLEGGTNDAQAGPCPSEPRAERAELVRLVRRIQALTLELQEPRRRELDQADVEAKERLLEQLRWQLAAVARRAGTEELGNAA
jgi:hypothetical protein